MTIKDLLLIEFECAINAIFGDVADKEIEASELCEEVSKEDIDAIAKKVKFYVYD